MLTITEIMQSTMAQVISPFFKNQVITVILKVTTAAVSTYGEYTKTIVSITTNALISNVADRREWDDIGIMPGGALLCKIWSLSSGGVNYLTREYFDDSRIDNIVVQIGDMDYKPTNIVGPESVLGGTPYWVMHLVKMESVRA